jgi:hypothetical protein
VEDHIHALLSFTEVDHGPESVHPLGNADEVKPCEARRVVVIRCAAAFVAQREAMHSIASALTPTCIRRDALKKLFQVFIRVFEKNEF